MIITCAICKWYNKYEGGTGTCKRFPPQIIRENIFKFKYGHPKTHPNDYCGEADRDLNEFPLK